MRHDANRSVDVDAADLLRCGVRAPTEVLGRPMGESRTEVISDQSLNFPRIRSKGGMKVSDQNQDAPRAASQWVRIPDGTMVQHRLDGQKGHIDGLTEIVNGPSRNPDGRTQYRINVGKGDRVLIAEEDLLILTDAEGLVRMAKEKGEYRSLVSKQLRGVFGEDRFVIKAS